MNKIQISNPLTIIGIFASLSEIAMTTAVTLVSEDLQRIFIWFIMFFPLVLVILFFITLNKNPKVLYAPSDFKDENLYIESLKLGMEVTNKEEKGIKSISSVQKVVSKEYRNKQVVLDNFIYENCKFINCKLIYSGEGIINLLRCTFTNTSWGFDGAAANTMSFLGNMYSNMGEDGKIIVDETVNRIKDGSYI